MRRVEIVMILGSVGLLLIVLELVRRRRLKEEYSLLWLLTAVVLLALSLWRSSLDSIAELIGIFYPPTALFVVGFGFVLLLLLYFSTIISKLSSENKGFESPQARRFSCEISCATLPHAEERVALTPA